MNQYPDGHDADKAVDPASSPEGFSRVADGVGDAAVEAALRVTGQEDLTDNPELERLKSMSLEDFQSFAESLLQNATGDQKVALQKMWEGNPPTRKLWNSLVGLFDSSQTRMFRDPDAVRAAITLDMNEPISARRFDTAVIDLPTLMDALYDRYNDNPEHSHLLKIDFVDQLRDPDNESRQFADLVKRHIDTLRAETMTPGASTDTI